MAPPAGTDLHRPLTAAELQAVTFHETRRLAAGYDEDEVDDFIDRVAGAVQAMYDRMTELEAENTRLREQHDLIIEQAQVKAASAAAAPPPVLRVSAWPARTAQVRLGVVSTPRGDPADPPVSPSHIAPSLAEEPADDVLRATPDFATASRMFDPGSARRRAFNVYSMHAIASDPKAMRGFLIASGMNLDTPVSEIISRGWQAFVPEVQWHIAVEVLVPAWLARAAPDFSDPRIWTAEPRQ